MKLALFCLFLPVSLWSTTSAIYNPGASNVGPFPSNVLTVPNSAQKTGLQISLPPIAGCTASSTSTNCVNNALLNQLDGFSVNPRASVCFSGPIDPTTIQAAMAFTPSGSSSNSVGVDQVYYDPSGYCAYVKPAHVLSQSTLYLLTVTSALHDAGGQAVTADSAFSNCVGPDNSSYCQSLTQAIRKFNGNGSVPGNVISASLFTTLSATTWLEKARAAVNSALMPSVSLPAGLISTFSLANVQSMTWKPDSGVQGVTIPPVSIPLNVLNGVEKVSFGLFLSPIYLNFSGPQAGSIPTTPTNQAIGLPNLILPISFHVFLPPASSAPSGGFPLIIYGHGLSDNQFGGPTYVAANFARRGFATLGIEITGHGYGPLSTVAVQMNGINYTVFTPGRGVQFSPTTPIGNGDGCVLPGALATRDCSRQSAVDLSALIRAIRTSDGLGLNINPNRIYYVGQSLGTYYGTLLEAIEPNLGAGTLNSTGGSQADVARLSPVARTLGEAYLASFSPSLLNEPPAPYEPYFKPPYFDTHFNDQYPYPGQITIDGGYGALPIQAAFESAEWLGMLGDPIGYAQHLKLAPLSGVPAKNILVQFGLGDLEIPNPTASALVRDAGLTASTYELLTNVAAGVDPSILAAVEPDFPLPIYPHRFLSNVLLFGPSSTALENSIATAAQLQIADFFSSNGATVSNPNTYLPAGYPTLFVIPSPLPEALSFFPPLVP